MRSSATLPAEPASAAAARQFVRATLADWQLRQFTDAASLLVSELVTNAVLHAGSVSVVTISYEAGVVRVEVSDSSSAQVQLRHYSADAGTGRGLLLVQAIAASWGNASVADGKRVWFELNSESLTRGAT